MSVTLRGTHGDVIRKTCDFACGREGTVYLSEERHACQQCSHVAIEYVLDAGYDVNTLHLYVEQRKRAGVTAVRVEASKLDTSLDLRIASCDS